jgi:hypothetical protein
VTISEAVPAIDSAMLVDAAVDAESKLKRLMVLDPVALVGETE